MRNEYMRSCCSKEFIAWEDILGLGRVLCSNRSNVLANAAIRYPMRYEYVRKEIGLHSHFMLIPVDANYRMKDESCTPKRI